MKHSRSLREGTRLKSLDSQSAFGSVVDKFLREANSVAKQLNKERCMMKKNLRSKRRSLRQLFKHSSTELLSKEQSTVLDRPPALAEKKAVASVQPKKREFGSLTSAPASTKPRIVNCHGRKFTLDQAELKQHKQLLGVKGIIGTIASSDLSQDCRQLSKLERPDVRISNLKGHFRPSHSFHDTLPKHSLSRQALCPTRKRELIA